jgi:hypothetical protein
MPDVPPPSPPTPAPKKNRTNAIIIGSAAAVIATIITTGIVVVQSIGSDSKPKAAVESSAPADDDGVTTAADEPEPEPTYAEVDADSFSIKLRTTERQCFGSAGCNVTVEPSLTYEGLEDLDPDAVYEITYEIRGDESGPVIETAELSDETTLSYQPTMISTVSSGTKVSVKITDVSVRGY